MAAILTGAELGQGPMWSLRSMHVVNGKPGLSAEAMRALVLAAGHEIWFSEHDAHTVTAVGRRHGSDHTTEVTWTLAQAERANLTRNQVWKTYPRAMLAARATTELCRLMFPDVIAGIATTEELEDRDPLLELAPPPQTAPPVQRHAEAVPGSGDRAARSGPELPRPHPR